MKTFSKVPCILTSAQVARGWLVSRSDRFISEVIVSATHWKEAISDSLDTDGEVKTLCSRRELKPSQRVRNQFVHNVICHAS